MKPKAHRKVWLIVTLDKPSGHETLSGILNQLADRYDWELELDIHPERVTPERVRRLVSEGIHAILLTMPCPPRTQSAMAATKLPIVCVNVQDEALASRKAPTRFVWTDNAAVGRTAAEHLLGCGTFDSYGFVGLSNRDWSDARGRGFRAITGRLPGAGAHFEITKLPLAAKELSNLRTWLRELPKPAALFAAYDEIAQVVHRTVRGLGLKIPDDIALIGADDTEHLVAPDSISSVRLAHANRSAKATSALARLLSGHPASSEPINVPPSGVTPRKSTRIRNGQRELVKRISDYLSRHALHPTCNADTIARQFACSRSTVEHRYREATGQSLYQAILTLRLAEARRLKAQSKHGSLAAIATACGFTSANRLSHLLHASARRNDGRATPRACT